jgi:hypothetical protein
MWKTTPFAPWFMTKKRAAKSSDDSWARRSAATWNDSERRVGSVKKTSACERLSGGTMSI